jgi:hypothetical protein
MCIYIYICVYVLIFIPKSNISIGGGKKAPTKAAIKGGKNVVAAKGVAPTKMKGKE